MLFSNEPFNTLDKIGQKPAVRVDEDNPLATCGSRSEISLQWQTCFFTYDHSQHGKLGTERFGCFNGAVLRRSIDNDNFKILVCLLGKRCKKMRKELFFIQGWDYER